MLRIQLTSNTAPIRPLTNRYMFVVQDYVRVPGGNSGGTSDLGHCFYTYNHDIDHPYFAHRPGFVCMKVKNQGVVATLGDEGKTRLTWLVNMNFGGMVPSAFVNGLLVGMMAFPVLIVEETEDYLRVRTEGDVTDLSESSPTQEEEEEGNGNGAALHSKRESTAELKLKAELAEMKAEMARKDEELRTQKELLKENENDLKEKDRLLEENEKHLKEKDKQMMELRRRLQGVMEE